MPFWKRKPKQEPFVLPTDSPYDDEEFGAELPGSWTVKNKNQDTLLLGNNDVAESVKIVIWTQSEPNEADGPDLLEFCIEQGMDIELQFERQHDDLGGYEEISECERGGDELRQWARFSSFCEAVGRRLDPDLRGTY